MQKLPIYQLKPNMISAENVLDFNHRLILEKGSVLTEVLIDRLFSNQIIAIYVEDENPGAVVTQSLPPAPAVSPLPDLTLSYSERVRQSQDFKEFKMTYIKNVSSFRGMLNDIVQKNAQPDINAILQESLELINSAKGKFSILDMLQNMRDYDDDTYTHCMNVALICNVLSSWLKFSEEEKELATACGLFHDIGKITVPVSIIRKPSILSREEYLQVRAHTTEGYRILKDMKANTHIQSAALMHHERMDGTGYPLNLKGELIDRYAKMVAIADVYDAMTSKRVYRDPYCPFEVIRTFEDEGFQRYETEFLLPFLEHVVNTYIQNRCQLSDGRVGTIIYVNKEFLSCPIVECDGEYVDLSKHTDLRIQRLL